MDILSFNANSYGKDTQNYFLTQELFTKKETMKALFKKLDKTPANEIPYLFP